MIGRLLGKVRMLLATARSLKLFHANNLFAGEVIKAMSNDSVPGGYGRRISGEPAERHGVGSADQARLGR